MKVKEMTISDVLQTVVFKNELGRLLSELDYIRKDAIGFKGGRLRSHPIDRLKNDGVWNKTKFIEVYEQTMDKTSNYPKTVRTFILSVGGEAFNKAMKILLENEKKSFSLTGTINNKGRLLMYMDEINSFFALHKGCRVIANFHIASKGSSAALKGYYFNCVVPSFKSAFWENGERLTDEQTEKRLREMSPIMYEQNADLDTGKYNTRIKSVAELSNAELVEHIETLKQIAAEDFSIYIEDPKTI